MANNGQSWEVGVNVVEPGEAALEAEQPSAASIQVDRIEAETVLVPIRGLSELIMHRFDEKAKQQMLDAMQSRPVLKEAKNPQREYEAAFYRLVPTAEQLAAGKPGTPGLPVIAFKSATIGGARFYGKKVTMTMLRQCIFFSGQVSADGQMLAVIDGEPYMREDVVRIGRGGADLRYRPGFKDWRTVLRVTYIPSMLTRNSLISLIDAGGQGVGVGEWRIERNGTFGSYGIDPEREVEIER